MSPIPISIEDSNPEWANIFQQLKEIIEHELKGIIIDIIHVGSTSIPNLAAKPIIDMDVIIESRELLPEITIKLQKLGYNHNGDQGIPGREAFKRESEEVPYTVPRKKWLYHHLYVVDKNSKELERHRYFRDYLINHPAAKDEYEKLKRKLAQEFRNQRDNYTDGKSKFIERILTKINFQG
jgi:GrpB-like predicted nucleotidyltransferase (UPF0157 family)